MTDERQHTNPGKDPCASCGHAREGHMDGLVCAFHAAAPDCCRCRRFVEPATPSAYRPMPSDVRASLVAFARATWRNDGAEGETVHRLCDELEHALRMGQPSTELLDDCHGEGQERGWNEAIEAARGKIRALDAHTRSTAVSDAFDALRMAQPTEHPSPELLALAQRAAVAREARKSEDEGEWAERLAASVPTGDEGTRRRTSDVSPAYCPYCPHCHPRTANPTLAYATPTPSQFRRMVRAALAEPADAKTDPPVCRYCDREYTFDTGDEPTPLCNACAHEIAAVLAASIGDQCMADGQTDPRLALLARWIVQEADNQIDSRGQARRDHACAECIPDGPIVIPGFRCALHVAREIVEHTPHPLPQEKK